MDINLKNHLKRLSCVLIMTPLQNEILEPPLCEDITLLEFANCTLLLSYNTVMKTK